MIEIKNLCAGYGKNQILHSISTSFEKGKLTAVIGPNGSGKSTLLKAVSGIIKPFSGEVLKDNKNILSISSKERAKEIAFLMQEKNMPDMTTGQMVLHGRYPYLKPFSGYTEEDKSAAEKAMECMGIIGQEKVHISNLSGGMRQRAYVAMALCQDTEYIFLDEPLAFVDAANSMKLIKTLSDLTKEGKGIIIVIHDLCFAMKYADDILVMNEGRKIIKDETEKIWNSKVIYDVFGVNMKRYESDAGYNYCIE